ncbi:MAG: hypothetical protein AAF581_05080 [Planctomycetota bacterium]
MRRCRWIVCLLLWGGIGIEIPVGAQEGGADDFAEIRKQLAAERRKNDEQQRRLAALEEQIAGAGSEDTLGGSSLGLGAVYGKGFLGRVTRSTTLGGYIDLEYFDSQSSDNTFRNHRFVPFIYSQLTEKVRFAAGIEFEYGGSDSPSGDGETNVEFAALDVVFHEAFGVRAGALLAPLGRFNLYHDSPMNDLTDRPLVDRLVIPSTLTEAGAGFFGTIYPDEESALTYEIYLVNGFAGLEESATAPTGFASEISTSSGLRDARASLKSDNNNSTAVVGRIAYSPFLGLEVGVSNHTGKYDDKGGNWLVLTAFDFTLDGATVCDGLAGWELLGEVARAEISRDSLARASGVPDDLWGFYTQVNYHFMVTPLEDLLPSAFGGEATFTAVGRLDHVELDNVRTDRLTFGVNYRLTEDTVFKFDYQFNFEDWHRDRVDNDAVVVSVASYF